MRLGTLTLLLSTHSLKYRKPEILVSFGFKINLSHASDTARQDDVSKASVSERYERSESVWMTRTSSL